MYPVLLHIGGFSLYSWGLMVAVAFVVGIAVAMLRCQKEGLSPEDVMDGAMYVLISAILGSRIFYVIGFWDYYRDNIWSVLAFWEGGMVFYGGLIFAMIALFIWARVRKMDVLNILDLASPSVAIGYSIGRIGCFLRGCCYGVECHLPWAMHFPESQGFVHPTQIYSSLAGLGIFVVLLIVRDKKRYNGQVFVWGVILYSLYRFIIEFFRYNILHWGYFSPSQWISVGLLGFCSVLIVYKNFSRSSRG